MHQQAQPYFSIEEALHVYKYALKSSPTFGIDIFENKSWDKDIVILQKNETVQKGIPIKFGFFALILCLEGESKRYINQYEFNIAKSSFQLIPPGAICSFENVTPRTEMYVLLFTENFIKIDQKTHVTHDVEMLFEFLQGNKENIDNVFLSDTMVYVF